MFSREKVINIAAYDNSVENPPAPQKFSSVFGIVSSYGWFSGARAPGPSEWYWCNAMLAKDTLLTEAPVAQSSAVGASASGTAAVALPSAEIAELIPLARAVLMKSPEDLAAIACAAPSMPSNWIEAFSAERARAEAEAKFWSTAIAYLMATAPGNIANDG